jgi:hypothetical protein
MSTYYNSSANELDNYLEENKRLNHTTADKSLSTRPQDATAPFDSQKIESDIKLNSVQDCSNCSSSNIKNEVDLIICSRCLWIASIYTNMKNALDVKCPICNHSINLELMPVSENPTATTITTVMTSSVSMPKAGISNKTKKSAISNSTSNMTFRIDKNVFDRFRIEASNHNMSINSFLNQTLREFTEWNMFMPTLGIPIPKPIVVQIFQKMDKDEIQNLATGIGKNGIEDMRLFTRGDSIDLDSFLNWFETYMKKCSVIVNHISESNKDKYIMKHGLGENWSLYIKTILEIISKKLVERSVNIEIYSNSILIFEIRRLLS